MEQVQLDKIYKFIKDSLYTAFVSAEQQCLVCDAQLTNKYEYLCVNCKEELSVDNISKCRVCNRLSHNDECKYCKNNKKQYEKIYTVFEYEKPIDKFINEFKEQGKTIYGRMFVKSLLDNYSNFSIDNIDLITSVPANRLRKITRLRDAPKYFAKALSKYTGIDYSSKCLRRKGFAKAMRKKTSKQRMDLASKSYVFGSYDVKDKNILLVDDVFTTGATTHVCSNLLIANGAKSVNVLAMICVKSR